MSTFADRLNSLRLAEALTQADLAKLCRVNASTVKRWLDGTSVPRDVPLSKLCDYFKVTPDYLLGKANENLYEMSAEEERDKLDDELVSLLQGLNPAQVQRVKDFVAGLKG